MVTCLILSIPTAWMGLRRILRIVHLCGINQRYELGQSRLPFDGNDNENWVHAPNLSLAHQLARTHTWQCLDLSENVRNQKENRRIGHFRR